jgi:hypothetical protein
MAELKTKLNDASVEAFINSVEDGSKRRDSFALIELMQKVTGEEPKMWGNSIVGFGKYHYKSKSGQEGDWFTTGFSPRKQNISIYLMCGFEAFGDKMDKLGKYKTGKGCLYINKLADINLNILEEMVRQASQFRFGI